MYSKNKLGTDLKIILEKKYNIIQISRWAEHVYQYHCRELSPELDEIIMALSVMEHGPEFEYSIEQLYLLAKMLINEEINIIEKINTFNTQ